MEKKSVRPLVSVVMPVYNAKEYIKAAVDSILNQSYSNFEFIIINDGSSDGTELVLDRISDSRVKVLENVANSGLVFTLNKGFDYAKGKYVARMDADDIAHPDRLAFQVRKLESIKEAIVCGTSFTPFDNNGEKSKVTMTNNNLLSIIDSIICHPSALIRRDFIVKHSLKYATCIEDFELWSNIYEQNAYKPNTFVNIDRSLLNYRIHSQQYTSRKRNDIIDEGVRLRRRNLLKFLKFYNQDFEFQDETKLSIQDFNSFVLKLDSIKNALPFPKTEVKMFLHKTLYYLISSLSNEELNFKILYRYLVIVKFNPSLSSKVFFKMLLNKHYRQRF